MKIHTDFTQQFSKEEYTRLNTKQRDKTIHAALAPFNFSGCGERKTVSITCSGMRLQISPQGQ